MKRTTNDNRVWYKAISVSLFYLFTFLPISVAQTQLTEYKPGVTAEGAVYFLPKAAIRFTLLVEKTTYTPGDFCMYAQRYMRLKDVAQEPSTSYRILTIRQEAVPIPDTTKAYAVKFDAKTVAANVALSEDGCLLAINAKSKEITQPEVFKAAAKALPVAPRQYLTQEILSAGSTAKMAELTAQEIYDLRENRNLLIKGQADFMPKDGDQLRLMLNQLDLQDRTLTSLFTGTTVKDTTEHTMTITPVKPVFQTVLFRFSQKLGLVDKDNLAGVPYYISIENLATVPEPEPVDPKKKYKQVPGIYVNIPGKMRSTISDSGKTILATEMPAGQFGNVELLSGALFNKRYTTHLWLNPISGAVEKLEAEQPK